MAALIKSALNLNILFSGCISTFPAVSFGLFANRITADWQPSMVEIALRIAKLKSELQRAAERFKYPSGSFTVPEKRIVARLCVVQKVMPIFTGNGRTEACRVAAEGERGSESLLINSADLVNNADLVKDSWLSVGLSAKAKLNGTLRDRPTITCAFHTPVHPTPQRCSSVE